MTSNTFFLTAVNVTFVFNIFDLNIFRLTTMPPKAKKKSAEEEEKARLEEEERLRIEKEEEAKRAQAEAVSTF